MTRAGKNMETIYTVSDLTRKIKSILENQFPFVWVIGEISNFVVPSSGHAYFSLKDSKALINCVMFRNQKTGLGFNPENGLKVMGLGRLSVYEPRGAYQLIFEHMEPEGTGSLQLAFEQLKKKLDKEGLFDPSLKKTIPVFPSKINLITSGTGAAVRDIIKVSRRRFPNCLLEILPVKVQGDEASGQIASAIELANEGKRSQLIILARGGGSIEDLAAFNSETVARAIFNSKIPVITGIGHETDFTIADFVADFRAPTPSAAAETALPDRMNLFGQLDSLKMAMASSMNQRLGLLTDRLLNLKSRLKSPRRTIDDFRLRIEEYEARICSSLGIKTDRFRERLSWLMHSLETSRVDPGFYHGKLSELLTRLDRQMTLGLDNAAARQFLAQSRLAALNPQAVLKRGYSIVKDLPSKTILTDASQAIVDDELEIILSRGRLNARVTRSIDKLESAKEQ